MVGPYVCAQVCVCEREWSSCVYRPVTFSCSCTSSQPWDLPARVLLSRANTSHTTIAACGFRAEWNAPVCSRTRTGLAMFDRHMSLLSVSATHSAHRRENIGVCVCVCVCVYVCVCVSSGHRAAVSQWSPPPHVRGTTRQHASVSHRTHCM